jgi:hypothetical protein
VQRAVLRQLDAVGASPSTPAAKTAAGAASTITITITTGGVPAAAATRVHAVTQPFQLSEAVQSRIIFPLQVEVPQQGPGG